MKTYVIFVAAFLIGPAGCKGGSDCIGEWYPDVTPGEIELSGDGRFVYIPAAWHYVPHSCAKENTIVGAVHVVDLLEPEAPPRVVELPVTVALAAVSEDSLLLLPWPIYLPFPPDPDYLGDPAYLRVSTVDWSVQTVPLPARAQSMLGVGDHVAMGIASQDLVAIHSPGQSDEFVPVGDNPYKLARSGGKFYVSTRSGDLSEIDPEARAETRRFGACEGSGPIAALGSRTIAVGCRSGGLDMIDLVDSTIATVSTAQMLEWATGEETSDAGLASFIDTSGNYYTQPLVIGSGGVGAQTPGRVVWRAVFTSDGHAFAAIDEAVYRIELPAGTGEALNHCSNFKGMLRELPSGEVLAVCAQGYRLQLLWLDPNTGERTREPVLIAPPPSLPAE